jgi:2-keto-3-deoxy-L-rhamnonate aldolase RhmA
MTETLVNAADAVSMASVIRVPDKQEYLISKSLDLGCDGVQIPMIEKESFIFRFLT